MPKIVSKNTTIKYLTGDASLLDSIKSLWESLNEHHLRLSENFKQHYVEMTFAKRKSALIEKAKDGKIRVDIAVDELSGQNVGYSVSSVDKSKTGEIQSIFVDAKYRGLGVGDALIRKTLAWMDDNNAESKVVEVGVGNDDAFGFYALYGFVPRTTVLKQTKITPM